ncbi:AAA domain-domain-containing protein [Aspergillus terreus]|uniref:AAA domain-domain-containing protein n=1 Tax=Aspergillus terreus TaxID=33178 RepID=A0A5M3Z8S4_ASPTE|nr:hypothetical protein ATETN484_0011019500 [Aspergillus terreus]GFF18832.1 AAA domain-domain-containing protein [Aspergillus terreus]
MAPSKAPNTIQMGEENLLLRLRMILGQPHQGHPSHVAKPFEHKVPCHMDIMFVVEAMMALSKKLDIAWEDMFVVSTVDSMPGNQVNIVIVDWVVTSGESSDLGFGADNRLINNDRLDGDETKAKVPPEILVHWKYLLDNDLIVPGPRALPNTKEKGKAPKIQRVQPKTPALKEILGSK